MGMSKGNYGYFKQFSDIGTFCSPIAGISHSKSGFKYKYGTYGTNLQHYFLAANRNGKNNVRMSNYQNIKPASISDYNRKDN